MGIDEYLFLTKISVGTIESVTSYKIKHFIDLESPGMIETKSNTDKGFISGKKEVIFNYERFAL
jgi:hypothetical protein